MANGLSSSERIIAFAVNGVPLCFGSHHCSSRFDTFTQHMNLFADPLVSKARGTLLTQPIRRY
jgi:hypothetical protein